MQMDYLIAHKNLSPLQIALPGRFDVSCINAIVIATGLPWREVTARMIERMHVRRRLSANKTVVTDCLRVCGFKSCHPPVSFKNFLKELAERGEDRIYIVRLRFLGYYVIVPRNGRGFLTVYGAIEGCDPENANADELWEYVPGSDQLTGIRRSRKKGALHVYQAHSTFVPAVPDPEEKQAGDSAVRALSAVLDCDWDDALDLLAETNDYTDPAVTAEANVCATLERLGLAPCPAPLRGGRPVNGRLFCSELNISCKKGERAMARVGKSRWAAFLPCTGADGVTRYRLTDTEDSSSKDVQRYWLTVPPANEAAPPEEPVNALRAGDAVKHPKFGAGMVLRAYGNKAEVAFDDAGTIMVACDWLTPVGPKKGRAI